MWKALQDNGSERRVRPHDDHARVACALSMRCLHVDSPRIRSLQMALSGCAEKRPLTDRCTRWHRYPVMGTSTWRARSDCVDSMGAQESDCRVLVIGRIFKLRERKQLGMDSNFGQQTYMYYALKALDETNASIAMAVVLQGRDQGRLKRATKMRAEQPWCVDSQHSGWQSRGPPEHDYDCT